MAFLNLNVTQFVVKLSFQKNKLQPIVHLSNPSTIATVTAEEVDEWSDT